MSSDNKESLAKELEKEEDNLQCAEFALDNGQTLAEYVKIKQAMVNYLKAKLQREGL